MCAAGSTGELALCYDLLDEALLDAGRAAVEAAGLGLRAGERIGIRERSLMGVVLPLVTVEAPPHRPGYGLAGDRRRHGRHGRRHPPGPGAPWPS
ncbi:hypothetical protein ACLG6S_15145 [Thermodesulfobacteriota bacterium B35]